MQAIQSRDDGGAGLRLVDRRLGSLLKRGGDVANVRLDRGWELLEFCALFFRGPGEHPHLVNNAKPRP